MRPFLLLASREDDAAADSEVAAFRRCGGLPADGLHRIRMEAGPLPTLDLDDYSGVFVGGSPFTSSDPEAEKSDVQVRVEKEILGLLDEIVDRDFPYLGACYGVGTLGVQQGAVVDTTYGEPVSAVPVTLSADGLADPLLAGMPPVFHAYVGHKEACTRLPDSAVLLASSPSCPVQMFRVRTNLYATQFHPELDVRGLVERIELYQGNGYFPLGEADSVIAEVRRTAVTHPSRIMRNFVERYART
ncbi:glutamine amidotransferase [Sanguibacter antarcticus]|uniref:GMP synthase (Glutamine-hydrolysing) n=1 Tax=Sanguibacter antarcticus TaxID=372484 RepID=A0A2A9E8V3_9MICO|nr:glutamine amidotransferase [Sanguibacter antarcticus]PFG34590.1 GMP synthase (glutamine-hydrolysing) [Sanguibacter antarcticus]